MRRCSLALACLCAVIGCGQGYNITELNGIRITVVGKPNQMNVVDDTATARAGEYEYKLAVAHGKLTVNGKDYGPVTKGDEVRLHKEEITINGKPAKLITPEQP
jgi:hypothetical protein